MVIINKNQSYIITNYLVAYSQFESKFRDLFSERISKIEKAQKDPTFHMFMAAKEITRSAKLSFPNENVAFDTVNFSKIKYDSLSLKIILRMNEKYCFFEKLPKEINSLSRKSLALNVFNSIEKIILTRNILAHETGDIAEKKIAEVDSLNDKLIEEHLPQSLAEADIDVSSLTEVFKSIIINLIYLEQIDEYIN